MTILKRTLGKSGIQVSALGLGTARIGGLDWQRDDLVVHYRQDQVDAAIRAIHREFRACASDYVTIPADLAQFSMESWLTEPNFDRVLSGNWERIGVGLDWGCPHGGGAVLVVILAGGTPLDDG